MSSMSTPSKTAGRRRQPRSPEKASLAAPAPNAQADGAGLSEAEIVRAAREIIAEAGVGGLTMRRLSNKLGVALGATYHHVAAKHDLLVLVGRDLYSEMSLPPHDGTWEEKLKNVMLNQVAVVGRYPGMANFMMTHVDELVPTELNQMVRGILVEAGFGERGIVAVMGALFFYVTGMVAGGYATPKAKAFKGRNMFALFEDGLDLLIAGAWVRLEEERKSKRARRSR
jgi:AcrR family transcriptional regulator